MMRHVALLFAVCSSVAALAGCAGVPLRYPEVNALTTDEACARLARSTAQRHRVSGPIQAQLPGMAGVVARADVDVVFEQPGRLSLSVRSFFEQPMQVLASDGATVTLFDGTRSDGHFFCGDADEGSLTSLLPIPVLPDDAVGMFLAAAPLEGARCHLMHVDDTDGSYTVALDRPRRGGVVVRARVTDDALLEWRGYTSDGRPLLWMRYGEQRTTGGLPFPSQWTLSLYDPAGDPSRGPAKTVLFANRGLEVNGAPFNDAAFRLQVPENEACQPLPPTLPPPAPRPQTSGTSPPLTAP